jgi:hypothetical protein
VNRLFGPASCFLLAILQGDAAPRYEVRQLTCAAFRETVRTTVRAQSGGDPYQEQGQRRGLLLVRARPGNGGIRFEAWYDSLEVFYDARAGRLVPDTDGLIGGRWEGGLTPEGTVELTTRPFIPPDLREVSDLSDLLLDFFPPLASAPMAAGATWTDSLGLTVDRLRDSVSAGRTFRRYRWRITSHAAPPAGEDTSVRIRQEAKDEGRLVWSDQDGAVAWQREITIDTRLASSRRRTPPYQGQVVQRIAVLRVPDHPVCR